MPALTESAGPRAIKVAASAPLELMWLLHNLEADHELIGPYASQEPIRRRFGPAAKAFWADGVRGYTDIVVIAERSDTLLDLDLERFFQRFERTAASDALEPSMLSETPFERKAVAERLHSLKADAGKRAAYGVFLRSVWEAACAEWESTGRAEAVATAERWAARLKTGATHDDIRQLIERKEIWKGRPQYDEMVDAAAADGRLVLSPGWFFGEVHLVELDGTVYLGHGIRHADIDEQRRRAAAHASTALKSLADPTRLAILMHLAAEPCSVTELARHLKLSQPTVSGHVQMLREAGLLEEKVTGRSARLSTSGGTVRQFFSAVQDELLSQIH